MTPPSAPPGKPDARPAPMPTTRLDTLRSNISEYNGLSANEARELFREIDRLREDAAKDATLLENCRVALRSIGPTVYHVDSAAERARRGGNQKAADALEHIYGRLYWLDFALGTLQERVDQFHAAAAALREAPDDGR